MENMQIYKKYRKYRSIPKHTEKYENIWKYIENMKILESIEIYREMKCIEISKIMKIYCCCLFKNNKW